MVLLCAPPSGSWRLINYRTAADVVTAEFLHDLYNRHRPEVNSYRFRNTLCIYHGTEFTSYAPIEEWDRLASTLGHRYLKMDSDLLLETRRHLAYDKPRLCALLARLQEEALPADPGELAQLLMSVHYTSLSEIYGINLVQIEHALTWALRSGLESVFGKRQTDRLLPELVLSSEPTMARLDQQELLRLSLRVSREGISLDEAAAQYEQRFGGLYHAYGAVEESCPLDKLATLCIEPVSDRERRLEALSDCSLVSDRQHSLLGDQPELAELGRLAAAVGETRDRNKALMGRVAEQRTRLLQHICGLAGISRVDLSRYLLSEIVDLLVDGRPVMGEVISQRWEPIVFQRQERLWQGDDAERLMTTVVGSPVNDRELTGLCASPGCVTGPIRHVRTQSDALAVVPGDIMVAFGTDFDLMDGLRTCAGIVTEEGGLLSHASVIARELNKPCLIGVRGAMGLLPDGATADLDADAGAIKVLEEPAATGYSLLPLHEVHSADVAGEKAAALARALRAGLPVLPGVVVPVVAGGDQFNYELAASILRALNSQGVRTELLIVRSSSPAEDRRDRSAAGMFASHVVRAEPRSLMLAMIRVGNSVLRRRVQDYFGGTPSIALLVQPHLQQQLGGVAFSRHPVTGANSVWIEASRQGAQAVVSGSCDERVELPRPVRGEEGGLLREVAEMVCSLETDLGCPVDVEWGVDDAGRLYLFQVRPITTLRGRE